MSELNQDGTRRRDLPRAQIREPDTVDPPATRGLSVCKYVGTGSGASRAGVVRG